MEGISFSFSMLLGLLLILVLASSGQTSPWFCLDEISRLL